MRRRPLGPTPVSLASLAYWWSPWTAAEPSLIRGDLPAWRKWRGWSTLVGKNDQLTSIGSDDIQYIYIVLYIDMVIYDII